MELAKVTVIIPCYNCAATILRAVDSILAQTNLPAEIILIDDKSFDNTLDIIQQLSKINSPSIKVIALPFNQGAANARNAGWAIATQLYIAFLDADDSWHPRKIEIQYKFMHENCNVMLCGHGFVVNSKGTFGEINISEKKITEINKFKLLFKNPFPTPTVMLKTNCPFRFQANKRYAEDFLLWLLIGFNEHRIVKIKTNLSCIFKDLYGDSGLSANLVRMELEELKNYSELYKEKKISSVTLTLVHAFSILKFLKRLIVTNLRAILNKSA